MTSGKASVELVKVTDEMKAFKDYYKLRTNKRHYGARLKKAVNTMQGTWITTVMVAMQLVNVGLNTLIKASISKGMSNFVYVVYSNLLAFCLLVPSTIFYHRNRTLPPITIWIIFRFFLLSLISCCLQTFLYTGIRFSSPALAATMEDLVPAYTFILAIICRMEKLDLKLRSCQARSFGTVISIAGALIVTLCKGQPVTNDMLPNNVIVETFQSEWLLGGFLLAVSCFCISILLIIQTWTLKDYPAELMLTTVSCGFVVILSTIVAFVVEENPKAWILKPDMELVSILISAIFVISTRSVVYAWACRKKGPVYVSTFNPLGIVIAFVMGVIFLGDALYPVSIIGAAIIAIGFYAVIWGQAQEEKVLVDEKLSSSAAPLLQNTSKDTS